METINLNDLINQRLKNEKKCNRFPLIEVGNGLYTTVAYKKSFLDLPYLSYAAKQGRFIPALTTVKEKVLTPIQRNGANSVGIALFDNGRWYYKSGCCASIKQTVTKTIYYFLPDVGSLSTKKKISYIKELEIFFGKNILQYVGITKGGNFENYFAKNVVNNATICSINDMNAYEVKEYPRTPYRVNHLVVKAAISHTQDNLHFLQFLRPIYQTISFVGTSIMCNKSDYSRQINIEYYQPRLYFRLKKLFPKLPQELLMYYSFCIHGNAISGTYFPYFFYTYKPYTKVQINQKDISNGINNKYAFCNGGEKVFAFKDFPNNKKYDTRLGITNGQPTPQEVEQYYMDFLAELRKSKFDISKYKVEDANNKYVPLGYIHPSSLLYYLFVKGTKFHYKKAIEIINTLVGIDLNHYK